MTSPPFHHLTGTDLRPGDVLLSRGGHWASWLIRRLDRGDYGDAGLYDGERVIVCGPCGVERRPLYRADVYRFHHDGRFLDPALLNGGTLPALLAPRIGDGRRHRGTPQYELGLLLITRRSAGSRWQRALVEACGAALIAAVRRSLRRTYGDGIAAITGAELISVLFLDLAAATGRPYGLLVEPEGRHGHPAWGLSSGRFERVVQDIEELLGRVKPDLPIAISRARSTAPGHTGATILAGGPLLPACFVTTGDLQNSPSLVPIGRLAGGAVSQRTMGRR